MTPSQGMLLFFSNSEELKLRLQKRLNDKREVFKFTSKFNEKKEGERFYNIWEYYEDGNKIFVQRAINQLKRTWTILMNANNGQNNENFGQEDSEYEKIEPWMNRYLERIRIAEDEADN